MKNFFYQALVGAIALLVLCSACASLRGAKMEDLTKVVDSFHKDLIFERYSIAAKNITPPLRAEYVNNINKQQLRFAEIEVMAMETCVPDKKECVYVTNQVQWYAGHSPVVSSSVITEKWVYDVDSGLWTLMEQEENK